LTPLEKLRISEVTGPAKDKNTRVMQVRKRDVAALLLAAQRITVRKILFVILSCANVQQTAWALS